MDEKVVDVVIDYVFRDDALKRRLRSALVWPLVVSALVVAVATGLLVFLMPRVELLYDSTGMRPGVVVAALLYLGRHPILYALCLGSLVLGCLIGKTNYAYFRNRTSVRDGSTDVANVDARFAGMLEPLMHVCLAMALGAMLVTWFLPLYDLVRKVH